MEPWPGRPPGVGNVCVLLPEACQELRPDPGLAVLGASPGLFLKGQLSLGRPSSEGAWPWAPCLFTHSSKCLTAVPGMGQALGV